MSAPGPGLKPLTGHVILDAMTNGTYWNLDASRTLTWGLANFASYYWTAPSNTAAIINSAFQRFAQFANIKFSYTGFYSDPGLTGSDIAVSLDGSGLLFPYSAMAALGIFPNYELSQLMLPPALRAVYQSAPGDIWLNMNSGLNYAGSYAPGSQAYAIILHEIGHVLGLKHPHDSGATGRPTFDRVGFGSLDIDLATIMSYNEANPWSFDSWHPATPMILDVIALQYLYGPNYATNAGNTTHSLTANGQFQTDYDPSGQDVIDLGASSYGWTISIGIAPAGDGALFPVGMAYPNDGFAGATTLHWLYGEFEAISGSAYADVITGSTNGEFFRGLGGNDNIDGGAGTDFVVFTTSRSNYAITRQSGAIVVTAKSGTEGVDTLKNVERVYFSDAALAFDTNGAAGQAYRLYQAAFNRMPDKSGLGYQLDALEKGQSLTQVAQNFINSPEFTKTYGNLSDAAFVTQLYANVLHRVPDSGGLSFHVNNLSHGVTRAQTLVGFSESPENQVALIGVIQNGMEYIPA